MPSDVVLSMLGPRASFGELRRHPVRYLTPSLLLSAASVLLLISMLTPFWKMTLYAPQYPQGLRVRAYLNQLTGDVAEIDELNHYIGMRKLNEAAQLERTLSIIGVAAMSLLVLAAIFIHSPLALPLAIPAVFFPIGFLVDLHYWLANFGQNLDPHAALSSAIKPFVPPVLGTGHIGQFRTVALPDTGLILAAVASLLILAGLWTHRRAYKPLFNAYRWVYQGDAAEKGAAA